MQGIYSVGDITETRDSPPLRTVPLYGFNVIGVDGRPVVRFSFATREEAEAAHAAMLDVIDATLLIEAAR